jgi:polysaccharide deacetylase 2 family uncharacterized protein YibQ
MRRPGLFAFWVVVLAGIGGGAAYLQYLGPPPPPAPVMPPPPPSVPQAAPQPAPQPATQPAPVAAAVVPVLKPPPPVVPAMDLGTHGTLARGMQVPGPRATLLVPSAINAEWLLPRIGPDGSAPMQVYAASQAPPGGAAPPPDAPLVAVIVAGIGNDPALAKAASALLPPPVSLGISPYGVNIQEAAEAARGSGHETLLVLPMPGLLAGAPLAQNQATLDWSMAQIEGYAGVTDAFGPAMGGGFMADPASRNWLLKNIAQRGLYYVEGDPDAGAAPYVTGRTADIVIDAADGAANEDAKLGALLTDAQEQHAALGILVNPTPAALHSLAEWTAALPGEGVQLVPASALVVAPDAVVKP